MILDAIIRYQKIVRGHDRNKIPVIGGLKIEDSLGEIGSPLVITGPVPPQCDRNPVALLSGDGFLQAFTFIHRQLADRFDFVQTLPDHAIQHHETIIFRGFDIAVFKFHLTGGLVLIFGDIN